MMSLMTASTLLSTLFTLAASTTPLSNEGEVPISVSLLDCGRIEARQPAMFNPDNNSQDALKMAISCYLIEHPKGTLLWDGGIPDALIHQKEGVELMDGAFHMSVQVTLESQLNALGYQIEDINYVAFSHLHMDHVGNANAFHQSNWLVQQSELDVAFDATKAVNYGFDPTTYSALKPQAQAIDGDYSVFGDGSVVILKAEGHSPGHQVLYLDLPETGPVVLSGDLYHTRANRAIGAIPVFNQPKQSRAAFAKIEGILTEQAAQLWIGHDLQEFNEMKKAPYRYR